MWDGQPVIHQIPEGHPTFFVPHKGDPSTHGWHKIVASIRLEVGILHTSGRDSPTLAHHRHRIEHALRPGSRTHAPIGRIAVPDRQNGETYRIARVASCPDSFMALPPQSIGDGLGSGSARLHRSWHEVSDSHVGTGTQDAGVGETVFMAVATNGWLHRGGQDLQVADVLASGDAPFEPCNGR